MLSLVPGLFLAGHETWPTSSPTCCGDSCRTGTLRALVADPSLGPSSSTRRFAVILGLRHVANRDARYRATRPIGAGRSETLPGLISRPIATSATTATPRRSRSSADGSLRIWRSVGHPPLHRCPLARLEARVALEVLSSRLPGLQLAEGFAPVYQPHPFLRGMAELPVIW